MPTALTYMVLGYANLIGLQPSLNNSAAVAAPTSISSIGQRPVQIQASQMKYTYTPGVGAHMVHSGLGTWNTARRTCELQGAHLVVINSIAEAEVVTQLLETAGSSHGWVGVHDFFQENEFVTILGQSLARAGFDSWDSYEPNNAGGSENCAIIAVASGKMNDISCSNLFRFVCELPDVQLYTGIQNSPNQENTPIPEFAKPSPNK